MQRHSGALPGRHKKKRVALEEFRKAVAAYLRGSSGTCAWEPQWKTIYERMPAEDASADDKIAMQEWLSGLKLECGKLSMSPTACHGCPENPLGTEKQQEKDSESALIERYWPELELASRNHTSSRLGLLTSSELSEWEFQCLSAYYWEVERLSINVRR